MQRIASVVLVTMVATVVLAAKGPASAVTPMTDAATVLADMRSALGGADAVAAVRTLTAEGTQRRMVAKGTTEGPIELAMELPDKFVTRTALTNLGSMSTYLTTGFNGDGLVYDLDAPPNLVGMGKGGKAAFAKSGAGKDAGAAADDKAEATRKAVLTAKQDFARLALGLLGSSYETFPLEFSYVAEAESADGIAHVIEARGAGNFEVRLFVDTRTNLPLMMRWTQRYPAAKGKPEKEVVHSAYYSDFRKAGDLILPHRLQRSVDAMPTEEIIFERMKINTRIDSKRFAVAK